MFTCPFRTRGHLNFYFLFIFLMLSVFLMPVNGVFFLWILEFTKKPRTTHSQTHFLKGYVPGVWDTTSPHRGSERAPSLLSLGLKPPSTTRGWMIFGLPLTANLTGRPNKSGGSVWDLVMCMSILPRVLDFASNLVFHVRLASSCSFGEPHFVY